LLCGEHLLKLLSYVLEMSKIEVGKQVLNGSNFDLYHHLLNSLEEMLQMEAELKDLQPSLTMDQMYPVQQRRVTKF